MSSLAGGQGRDGGSRGENRWSNGSEGKTGMKRREGRVGCKDGRGRGDWLLGFDSMSQIDCGCVIQLVMAVACRRGAYGGVRLVCVCVL